MIAIVDYGMGNLFSVKKALERVGASATITDSPDVIRKAQKIVLPGVGAFGDAMNELRRRSLVEPILEAMASGIPFLGICLGLQVLFEKSEESPGIEGLGVLRGEVKRFVTDMKVPHMGWNQIRIKRRAPIYEGITDGAYVYFVHSYYVVPTNAEDIATTTDYSVEFTSSVWRKNLYAMQFHPEKSQLVGLKILRNFAHLEGGER